MDPNTVTWVRLAIEAVGGIVEVILDRVARGDATVLDLRVRDVLPTPLLTSLEKAAADAAAAAKFPPAE